MSDDTADLPRPDRLGLVIDLVPDFAKLQNKETGEITPIQVVQIWLDPKRPDAHRDPRFRNYVERRAKEGVWCLIRRNAHDGFALVAPFVSEDRQWHELDGVVNPYWRAGEPPAEQIPVANAPADASAPADDSNK
ncbi:MAG TPA: hypothetical protein VKB78_03285 [Pirellulales bacterium]|nr:hypothetical protein [Pirellulales bacterium]